MTNANYQTAGDVFDGWSDDVLSGSPPALYPIGTGDDWQEQKATGTDGRRLTGLHQLAPLLALYRTRFGVRPWRVVRSMLGW